MSYTPFNWQAGISPLDEFNMNHLETQYTEAAALIAAYIPTGMILMWHGTIANIPAGWLICDGNNGTPNLLARFVEGVATAATDPGTTGGSTAKTTQTSADTFSAVGAAVLVTKDSHTHNITDIRPKFYDIAFIMKT